MPGAAQTLPLTGEGEIPIVHLDAVLAAHLGGWKSQTPDIEDQLAFRGPVEAGQDFHRGDFPPRCPPSIRGINWNGEPGVDGGRQEAHALHLPLIGAHEVVDGEVIKDGRNQL